MPPQPVIFPVKGLHKTSGFDLQPPGTTSDLLNVRAHDALESRVRGGRRAGLSKWHDSALNAGKSVQAMTRAVRAASYSAAYQNYVFAGHTSDSGTSVRVYDEDGTSLTTYDTGDRTRGAARDTDGNYYIGGDLFAAKSVWKINSGGVLQWSYNTGHDVYDVAYDETNDQVVVCGKASDTWTGNDGTFKLVWALDGTSGALLWTSNLGSGLVGEHASSVGMDADGNIFVTGDHLGGKSVWKYDSDGNLVASCVLCADADKRLAVNNAGKVLVVTMTATATWPGNDGSNKNIFILSNDLSTTEYAYDIHSGVGSLYCAWSPDGNFAISSRTVSGGVYVRLINYLTAANIWTFNTSIDAYQLGITSSGDVVVGGERNNGWPGAGGTNASVWCLAAADGAVLWTKDPAAAANGDSTVDVIIRTDETANTRESSLVAVAGGDVKMIRGGDFYTVTNGAGAMLPLYGRLALVPAFDRVFMVDGTYSRYLDLADNTVKDWAADVTPAPADFQAGARLLALYRGRVVLSGVETDSHNWFMSKVGNPFDFDYSPADTSAIQAVAGNNAPAGLVGDIITALIPFGDDAMLMGGDQTIWQMTGDPAAGGAIDMVSDKTGIVFGRAWAKDPTNKLYFMGVGGVYSMFIGEQPVSMTDTRLAKDFGDIDLSANRILLEWDINQKGLYVGIYPITDLATDTVTVYFWDARVDGWFKDSYPLAMGPSSLLAYDAESADDRAMLFGCRDSYIRQVDTAASNDDGTGITNHARLTPLQIGDGITQAKLNEINISLAENSGSVDMKIYAGQTAQKCQESTTCRFKRTVKAGHNPVTRPRISGNTLQIELSQTAASARWALENMSVSLIPSGRTRKGA